MSKAPAYQFYPDKWEAGTGHLSVKAYRVYHRLLNWMWLHSDTQWRIIFEKNLICSVTGLAKRMYDKIFIDEIMQDGFTLLRVEDNYLVSNGLRKEAEKQKRYSEAGKTGANARWSHDNRNAVASKSHTQSQCSPTPSLSPTPIEEKKLLRSKEKVEWVEDHFIVPDKLMAKWVDAHELKDVRAEIAKAECWYMTKPERHARGNHGQFLAGWLGRAKDTIAPDTYSLTEAQIHAFDDMEPNPKPEGDG